MGFCKNFFVDIASAWEKATPDQKSRIQNALLATGLKYNPKEGILTCENDSLFRKLHTVMGGKIQLARPERFELPTYCSGGNRSIQLSYGRALCPGGKNASARTRQLVYNIV